MYEELVKKLRSHNGWALNETLDEAADAIEQLSNAGSAYGRGWTLGYDAGSEENKPRWIPVTERLPEHLTSVIVHKKDGGIFIWEYFDTSPTDECWIDDSMSVYAFYDVTHWMQLPQPPKEE